MRCTSYDGGGCVREPTVGACPCPSAPVLREAAGRSRQTRGTVGGALTSATPAAALAVEEEEDTS